MKKRTILLATVFVLGLSYGALAQQQGLVGRAKFSGPLPDLTIGRVYVVDSRTVRLDVLNMGEVASPGSYATIYVYDANGRLMQTQHTFVPALEPGPPVFVVFDNVGGSSGMQGKRYRVKVDSRNTVRESNEANNWSKTKIGRVERY